MKGFFKTMLRDYLVGAFAASSRFVVARVLKEFRPEYRTVLEYGPGDGVATRAVLAALSPNGTFRAVEHNRGFAENLEKTISDPRFSVEQGDAVRYAERLAVEESHSVDAIISSIPLSFLSREERDRLFFATHTLVKPTGVFVVFHQYSLFALPLLKKYFRTVEWHFEPRNVFPCFVMIAKP